MEDINNFYKKEAIDNFNKTWDLIEKKQRTHDENIEMIHRAHASRYHWGQIGNPVHLVRGEWQISRVYSLLNMAESALLHAEESLRICEENSIGDLDLAFAYEAIARAYSIFNDTVHKDAYIKKSGSVVINDRQNRDYLFSELDTIK